MTILRSAFAHRSLWAAIGALAIGGCSSSPGGPQSSLVERQIAWAFEHGGCECGPAAFPPGDAGATGEYSREADVYVRHFLGECRQPQVLIVAYGDGAPDIDADMTLARARAYRIVRGLLGKRPWINVIWFGGPHVAHAATAEAMCLTQRMPRDLRPSDT